MAANRTADRTSTAIIDAAMANCSNNNTYTANCMLLNHLATPTTITATTTAAAMEMIERYSTVKIILISMLVTAMVISNSLIVNAFLTSRRLQKKPSNFLITSQAASDLFTCLVFFPVHVVERYHRRIHVEGKFFFSSFFYIQYSLHNSNGKGEKETVRENETARVMETFELWRRSSNRGSSYGDSTVFIF